MRYTSLHQYRNSCLAQRRRAGESKWRGRDNRRHKRRQSDWEIKAKRGQEKEREVAVWLACALQQARTICSPSTDWSTNTPWTCPSQAAHVKPRRVKNGDRRRAQSRNSSKVSWNRQHSTFVEEYPLTCFNRYHDTLSVKCMAVQELVICLVARSSGAILILDLSLSNCKHVFIFSRTFISEIVWLASCPRRAGY